MDADMKAALAAKGYDLVENEGDGSDSDDGIPGRIKSLEPDVAREKGKKAFEQGKYEKAIKCWQGGLKSILSALCAGPEAMSNTSLSELDLTLNLNIAMAYIKMGDNDAADRSIDKALARRDALPPHLISKALYRKASVQRSMHRLDECLATLKDLLEVEPTNAAGLQMQQEVDREWQRQIRNQKSNLKKLFSKMEGQDKKEGDRLRQQRAEARAACGVVWTSEDVDSTAFELGEAPGADGKDWGLALSRTVVWSIEQFAIEGDPILQFGGADERVSAWFLGASSTCELRWLQPSAIMARLPSVVALELVLIGFLGELDPDNKRAPDPKADNLPKVLLHKTIDEGARSFSVRVLPGTLQDVLAKAEAPPTADTMATTEGAAPSAVVAAAAGQAPPALAATGAVAEPPLQAAAVSAPTVTAATVEVTASGGGAAPEEGAATDTPPAPAAIPAAGFEEAAAAAEADSGSGSQKMEESPLLRLPSQDPPTVCFLAHPQLHRYYTDFFPAITWLIKHKVPTILVGASDPDLSWKQDEMLLKAIGACLTVSKRESPYPMCLPDNAKVKKCNHVIGFRGGKPMERENLTKVKLELLSQDYTVR